MANALHDGREASFVHREEKLSGEQVNKEIKEMDISEVNGKLSRSKCELCVVKNTLFKGVSVFLCFVCEIYVCVNCMPDHTSHEGLHVDSKGNEEREKRDNYEMGEQTENERSKYNSRGLGKKPKRMRQEESETGKDRENRDGKGKANEKERIEENIERNKKVITFVDELLNESDIERNEKLKTNHISIYDHVEIKHELDENAYNITGLCGIENKRWIVCDRLNSCIKIFKLGRNVMERYIKFESQPWDVTEIHEKQSFRKPTLLSTNSSDTTLSDRTEPLETCLVAVTLPWKRQIKFIALHEKPALIHRKVSTEKSCYYIQYCNDKIFTVCREDLSPCSVYIKSTDGDTLNVFDTGISFYVPPLAVVSGRIYLSVFGKNKVQCRDIDGHVISENAMKRSRPVGISVDKGSVYVCASLQDKVYELDSGLTRYRSVLDQTAYFIEKPNMLCYYRDKLFISHHQMSSLENYVTVVRLL